MQLLCDFATAVKKTVGDDQLIEARAGSLTASLRVSMLDIMSKHPTPPAKDKVVEVQEQVDVTKVKMQENIQTIIESLTTLEDLEEKSRSMSQRADDFCKKSVALKHQVRIRNLKVKIITATCAGAVLLYLLLPLMQH